MNLVENKYSIEELEHIIANNVLDDTDWTTISSYQSLTESFIEKYSDKINWTIISTFQKLSEEFIEKHSDKVKWSWISVYQELSESFIIKYIDKLSLVLVVEHQKLSYEFMERNLYKYSLYTESIIDETFINREHFIKLQEKYEYKYQIDKLTHEIQFPRQKVYHSANRKNH